MNNPLAIDTTGPCPFPSSLALSAVSTASTDTAYSHFSYEAGSSITHRADNWLALTEVLTFSPEDTDTEEADHISTDDVPYPAATDTLEGLDISDDSEGTNAEPVPTSLTASWYVVDTTDEDWECVHVWDGLIQPPCGHVLDTADEDWECVHVWDGLIQPPTSPVQAPRTENTFPPMSLPSSTLVTLALLALVTPTPSAAAPDASDPAVHSSILLPPAPVAWSPRKMWPVWAVLLLTLGIAHWFVRGLCDGKRQAAPELDVITCDDLVLLSATFPPAASGDIVPMERTRRSSGYTRGRIEDLDDARDTSQIGRGVVHRAAVATASVVLLASVSAASPAPSVARLGAQPFQWSALALAAPVMFTAVVWAFRSPARLDSTFTPRPPRRAQTVDPPITCSAAYLSALAFVPAAMAEPTFAFSLNPESSSRKMHPGAIAAIALGIVLAPFVLLTLAEVFGLRTNLPLRAGILRARLYRCTVIAGGLTLGLALGLVLMPFFAVYMLAVFVAAVTSSYSRYAGLDTTGWWQGQTTQWPARIVRPPPLSPTVSVPDLAPNASPITPHEKDKCHLSSLDAMPLPIYPPPVYARSVAVVVILALAVPRSA